MNKKKIQREKRIRQLFRDKHVGSDHDGFKEEPEYKLVFEGLTENEITMLEAFVMRISDGNTPF